VHSHQARLQPSQGHAQGQIGPTAIDVHAQPIKLHPLRRSEFELLGQWLAEPLVARWWAHDTSREAVEREYGAAVDGREPTTVLIAELAGRPFGLIQYYPIAPYPDYLAELARLCQVPEGAVGIDYLIGSADHRGRGLGTRMIATCLERIWTERPEATAVIVPVHVENRASWRALERAGFRRIAEGELQPDNPGHSREHYVYRLDRPAT
jgi:aminoglycoside 6'-N-acetyltransferase